MRDEYLQFILPRDQGKAETSLRVVIAEGDDITPGLRATKSPNHYQTIDAADANAVEYRFFGCEKYIIPLGRVSGTRFSYYRQATE